MYWFFTYWSASDLFFLFTFDVNFCNVFQCFKLVQNIKFSLMAMKIISHITISNQIKSKSFLCERSEFQQIFNDHWAIASIQRVSLADCQPCSSQLHSDVNSKQCIQMNSCIKYKYWILRITITQTTLVNSCISEFKPFGPIWVCCHPQLNTQLSMCYAYVFTIMISYCRLLWAGIAYKGWT